MSVNSSDLECGEPADKEVIKVYEWWVSGLATLITGGIGILGNLLSIMVLCKKSMKNLFHHLLAFLCIADLMFIITNLLMVPRAFNSNQFSSIYLMVEWLCHFSMAASVFLTIGITIERYQAVCCPYKYVGSGGKQRHYMMLMVYVIPSFILAAAFNVPRFMSNVTHNFPLEFLKFLIYFQVVHPLSTTGLIPIVTLGVMNYKIYQAIPTSTLVTSRRRRAKHFRMARIAVVLVLIFIVFNTPRLTIGIYEVTNLQLILSCFSSKNNYHMPVGQLVGDIFSQYFAVVNSSVNFVAYCMLGSQFQAEFIAVLDSIFHFKNKKIMTPMTRNSVVNNDIEEEEEEEKELGQDIELQEIPIPNQQLEDMVGVATA